MGKEEKLEKARQKKEKWEVARMINQITLEMFEKAVTESETSLVKQILEDTIQEGWRRIMGKEEKVEKAKKKKDKWELTWMVKLITMEMVEKAVSQSENKHVKRMLEDTLQEGWRRIETTRILQILDKTDEEIQARVLEACLRKKEEERSLLAALRLEEEKQRRLERTRILKLILSKKLGAIKLRMMVNMMNQMSLEELEMEVEEVEVRVMEMMETDEMTDDATYNQKGEYVNTEVEMTDDAAPSFEINNDAPNNKQGKLLNSEY